MKIALIELGSSHDECLYSQIKILTSNSDIQLTLICNTLLKENVKHFELEGKTFFFTIKKGISKWLSLFKIWQFCYKNKFDKIIFNTATGKSVQILLLFPFHKQTKYYGTIHNIGKLNKSKSQKFITKRLSHFFILNEYLSRNLKIDKSFSSFYPIFFPDYKVESISKSKDEIWICVPGQVELKRRDYKTLFESIEAFGIQAHLKILLLGRYGHFYGDGPYILEQIERLNLKNNIMIWKDFIPVENFHNMVRMSDYILPLIHPGDESGLLYENQITGAFNLAIGYKKPLILETSVSDKFPESISYEKHKIIETLNSLKSTENKDFYQDKKWTFEYQKEIYLKGIGVGK